MFTVGTSLFNFPDNQYQICPWIFILTLSNALSK